MTSRSRDSTPVSLFFFEESQSSELLLKRVTYMIEQHRVVPAAVSFFLLSLWPQTSRTRRKPLFLACKSKRMPQSKIRTEIRAVPPELLDLESSIPTDDAHAWYGREIAVILQLDNSEPRWYFKQL